MYYSFKCTECGRLFYTYNQNKSHAANTLYHSVKQHLIDYNEDHKEHELDDGEYWDSHQIMREMTTTDYRPQGYEARESRVTFPEENLRDEKFHDKQDIHASNTSKLSHPNSSALIILIVIIVLIAIVFFFFPNTIDSLKQLLIPFTLP